MILASFLTSFKEINPDLIEICLEIIAVQRLGNLCNTRLKNRLQNLFLGPIITIKGSTRYTCTLNQFRYGNLFQVFFLQQLQERNFDGFSCNCLVFLVKSFQIFQGFLWDFSFCHNIHFLSVTPDEIYYDSNALHDKIVKEDKTLVNVHYADMRYKPMKWKIIADSGCDYRS